MGAEIIVGMARPGPKRGAPQRQWLSPDAKDEDERVAIYAQVTSRARARGRRAAAAAQLSFAAYVEALLLRDDIDDNGCPTWAAHSSCSESCGTNASSRNVSQMLASRPAPRLAGR